MRLRLESGNGSAAKEYRVEDGNVEVRTLDPGGIASTHWEWMVAPYAEQLSIHVERNTGVAQWLERRPLETSVAGMCTSRTEDVESYREHKSSSSLIPPFEMATLDEIIALLAIVLPGPSLLCQRKVIPDRINANLQPLENRLLGLRKASNLFYLRPLRNLRFSFVHHTASSRRVPTFAKA